MFISIPCIKDRTEDISESNQEQREAITKVREPNSVETCSVGQEVVKLQEKFYSTFKVISNSFVYFHIGAFNSRGDGNEEGDQNKTDTENNDHVINLDKFNKRDDGFKHWVEFEDQINHPAPSTIKTIHDRYND